MYVKREDTCTGNWNQFRTLICVRFAIYRSTCEYLNVFRTAAIRYHNSSCHDVVRIEGTEEYKNLMRGLAVGETRDTIYTSGERWKAAHGLAGHSSKSKVDLDLAQHQLTQYLRNPAQIIGSLLYKLKASAKVSIPQPFSSALATFPNFPGLQYQVVLDAFNYASIHLLNKGRVAPVAAAAAANGLGLCETYTELDVCDVEEAQLAMKRVLTIDYTRAALTVTLSPFQASHNSFDWNEHRAWNLGADALPGMEGGELDEYWQLVRYEIQKLPKKVQPARPITHVVLTGESALNEAFLDVVRDALSDVLLEDVALSFTETSVTNMVSPLFATARGAAELAKRELESPYGCVETCICRWWRK